jgi:hypothetical protein
MSASGRLFDRYLMVDWSASNVPKRGKDSIWIRSLGVVDDRYDLIENPRTRTAARERVRAELCASVARRERVLVGFDFPYGYPRGLAEALGLSGLPWRAIWRYLSAAITDGPGNVNNRFEVASELNRRLVTHAYWGCPHGRELEYLSPRKDEVRYSFAADDVGLPEWREAELALRARGIHPQAVWKLLGAGSVGSQALVGIPVVAALRDDPDLQPFSSVWPFETRLPELESGRPTIVHVEIWPSIVDVGPAMLRDANAGKVRDQVQVEELALYLRARDEEGLLPDLFAAASPAAAEEGWIFGTAP